MPLFVGLGGFLRIEGAERRIGLHQVRALVHKGFDDRVGDIVRQIVTRDQVRAEIARPRSGHSGP